MKLLNNYFSEETLSHLKPQQGLSERYQRRALDVTLACKLTHVYGKYHLAMLHRQLAMSEEQTTYQQAPMHSRVPMYVTSRIGNIENEKIRAKVRANILLRLYPLLPAKRASRLSGTATYLCPMK